MMSEMGVINGTVGVRDPSFSIFDISTICRSTIQNIVGSAACQRDLYKP